MTRTKVDFNFTLQRYPTDISSILQWLMTVISFQATDKEVLAEAVDHIFQTWQSYEDREADIIPFTGDTPHNTITPIVRYREGQFEFDIALRNNRTTVTYPMGIFH